MKKVRYHLLPFLMGFLLLGCEGIGTAEFGSIDFGLSSSSQTSEIPSGTSTPTPVPSIPNIPSTIDFSSPASSPSTVTTPTVTVNGVSEGDTVAIFTDASCSTQVGSAVVPAGATSVAVTTSPLGVGEHSLYSMATSTGGSSSCSGVLLTYEVLSPPPSVPSSIDFSSPASSPSSVTTPTVTVNGVSEGDTVAIFTDASCSTQVGSAVVPAGATSVDITTSPLGVGEHSLYSMATSTGGSSSCSGALLTYEVTGGCPSGYIYIPGNSVVGAPDDFCVMQFEAKDDGGGNPISQAEDPPWGSISQGDAYNACRDLNTEGSAAERESDANGDGTYALISNPEWMAIARNIENIESNWTGGSVGDGCLFRGNVGEPAQCTSGDMSVIASGYASNGGSLTFDYGTSRSDGGTAQLTLSNGLVIWDFSGNMWEWVDWTLGAPLVTNIDPADTASISSDTTEGWKDYPDLDTFTSLFPATSLLPSDPTYDRTKGVGGYYYYPELLLGRAPRRGGGYVNGANAGAFCLNLDADSASTELGIGFRCVFRFP